MTLSCSLDDTSINAFCFVFLANCDDSDEPFPKPSHAILQIPPRVEFGIRVRDNVDIR